MYKAGDKVRIIKSPYFFVKPGTICRIVTIQFNQYPETWKNYILDNPGKCHAFKLHEIEKIKD